MSVGWSVIKLGFKGDGRVVGSAGNRTHYQMLREMGEMSLLICKEIRVGLGHKLMYRWWWLVAQVEGGLLWIVRNKRNVSICSVGIAGIYGVVVVVETATTALTVLIRLICLVLLFRVWLIVSREIVRHTCLRWQRSSRVAAWIAVV